MKKNILAIGNSFSEDAVTYLHDIAENGGFDCNVVNLYIGGCSLETHWNNAEQNLRNYDYQKNGIETGRKVSILETLLEESWDYITLQQASHDSGQIETYYPYISHLSSYIKKYVPNAVQMIHQTWAYEIDSIHEAFARYQKNQKIMYQALSSAYEKVASDLNLELIPCGKVIQTLRSLPGFLYPNNGISLCRDGFHMNLVYGRYAVAATWYECLFHGNILENNYLPPEIENIKIDESLIKIIKRTVYNICKK